jgi:DNA-binding transcriptional ArsR family regulator
MSPRKKADLSDVLFALADPTRRQVVELVGRAPRRASELAEAIGASRLAMSRHLRILREAGVIRDEGDEEDGRARLIALDERAFAGVRAWLDGVEGFWSDQLASFKTLAEARAAERREPRRRRKVS